jgi:hypothetical protein
VAYHKGILTPGNRALERTAMYEPAMISFFAHCSLTVNYHGLILACGSGWALLYCEFKRQAIRGVWKKPNFRDG